MSDQIPCPGGCGNQVHARATECPRCGFRAEIAHYQDLLSSLGTIGSILLGFGLAALVSLTSADPQFLATIVLQVALGFWLVSSILLLVVLVMAEWFRREEATEKVIRIEQADEERIRRRCEWLMWVFVVALGLMAVGTILAGFHFSWLHGFVTAGAALAGIAIICRLVML